MEETMTKTKQAKRRQPIVIEVRGGIVQEVRNVPPGYAYEIKDYDHMKPLPPDPDGQNPDRARWAGRAIAAFQKATSNDDEDVPSDLLADLMHWADRHDDDFVAALSRGRDHYDAETGGEE